MKIAFISICSVDETYNWQFISDMMSLLLLMTSMNFKSDASLSRLLSFIAFSRLPRVLEDFKKFVFLSLYRSLFEGLLTRNGLLFLFSLKLTFSFSCYHSSILACFTVSVVSWTFHIRMYLHSLFWLFALKDFFVNFRLSAQ